jgi:hypothetical protein
LSGLYQATSCLRKNDFNFENQKRVFQNLGVHRFRICHPFLAWWKILLWFSYNLQRILLIIHWILPRFLEELYSCTRFWRRNSHHFRRFYALLYQCFFHLFCYQGLYKSSSKSCFHLFDQDSGNFSNSIQEYRLFGLIKFSFVTYNYFFFNFFIWK